MKTITFRSEPFFFYKEKDGTKPFTVRKLEDTEERYIALNKMTATHITIAHTNGMESFTRKITDVTYMPFFQLWSIAWKHEEDNK